VPKNSPAGRQEFARRVEARRREEQTGACEPVGWYVGSDELRQELPAQVSEWATPKVGSEQHISSKAARRARQVRNEDKLSSPLAPRFCEPRRLPSFPVQLHPWPETHCRAQRLQSEALKARTAGKSAITGGYLAAAALRKGYGAVPARAWRFLRGIPVGIRSASGPTLAGPSPTFARREAAGLICRHLRP
jgi:hypothetical protein